MKFEIDKWPIAKLIQVHESGGLNLNPSYQRNDIWLKKMKQKLIDSIMRNYPMPAFFLHKTGETTYDMVDGQQRTRAIMGYKKGVFTGLDGKMVDQEAEKTLQQYLLIIVTITEVGEGEFIHEFYDRVNSLGLHLKRGETLKAKYRGKKLLELVIQTAESEGFQSLGLFSDRALERMDDIDFVSELITIIKHGITEKKKTTDQMFIADVTADEATSLKTSFDLIIKRLLPVNALTPLSETRYSQKNDFYTLFHFLHSHPEIIEDNLVHMYRLLTQVDPFITPSNERCPPLQDYAFDCVSQSNSVEARRRRLIFFESVLLNPTPQPNDIQQQILDFFQSPDLPLMELQGFYTIDYHSLGMPQESLAL